ncbi:MAG: arsenite methyltransferase [Thermomicrobiales bacterium]|jgi:SAM-dependent methyltransferase|nr:arsenite methyltransferase [Thermomicrobiales bacterium]
MGNPTPIQNLAPDELRRAVAERYGQVARQPTGAFNFPVGRAFAGAIGYPPHLLDALPTAAASFAGVAYLPAWTALAPGETVVDLGCGAGLDTLIVAQTVGPGGRVHAVDVSAEMVELAQANARAAGLENVVAHHAPVEALPLPDAAADVAIANGVFNLAPEKERAAGEVFRVLKPGGRLVGAEIVLTEDVPRAARATLDDWFR